MMAAVSYKTGQKNNFRRQVWNSAAEMGRLREGVVLYLAGESDLDRPVACSTHGLLPENLIAVERDRRVCASLRKRGVLVIPGGISDVMTAWPDDFAVSAVMADLQCGFGRTVERILSAYLRVPAFAGAVLAINLQRGRDSGPWLSAFGDGDWMGALRELTQCFGNVVAPVADLHRGRLVLLYLMSILNANGEGVDYKNKMSLLLADAQRAIKLGDRLLARRVQREHRAVQSQLQFKIISGYRTSRVTMDWTLLRWSPLGPRLPLTDVTGFTRQRFSHVRALIAACRAVRTRRLKLNGADITKTPKRRSGVRLVSTWPNVPVWDARWLEAKP